MSSTAHTFTSTSPVGSATSRMTSSVMSVSTPDDRFGQLIQSPPSTSSAAHERREPLGQVGPRGVERHDHVVGAARRGARPRRRWAGPGSRTRPARPSTASRCPSLIPSFFASGVPEYPATAHVPIHAPSGELPSCGDRPVRTSPSCRPARRNMTLMRGPAWARLGTQCSKVRWQVPPCTSRSPECIGNAIDCPPPSGRSSSVRVDPSDRIATTASDRAVADAVAVPRDGVVAVAVEVGGDRRELDAVAAAEAAGHAVEHRGPVGPRAGLEARHVDDPVVHRSLERLPRRRLEHRVEQRVGPGDPARHDVDPRAPARGTAAGPP